MPAKELSETPEKVVTAVRMLYLLPGFLQLALYVVAMVFLFQKSASSWFSDR